MKFRFLAAFTVVLTGLLCFGATFVSAQTTSDSPVITVTASSVGSFKFSLHGMILEDVKLKGTKVHSARCHWVGKGYNSGRGVDGKLHYFLDHHMYVCPNRHSPTGWVKVKGGMTGRNCGNPVAIKRPKHVVKVVTLVKSFAKVHIVVKAMATASVTGSCPNSNISGSASSSGMVSTTINETTIVQAKGSAGAVKVIVSQSLKASGVASATANLHLTCPAPPPPPPPPPSKAHAWLVKTAIKDGANVALSGGEFTFSVTVNGTPTSSTTNAATGQSRDLGQFNPGDSVQVCETGTGGYTPDQVCISHTMAAGENFTFSFVNRKNSPPPPSPPTIGNMTVVQEMYVNETRPICVDTYIPAGEGSGTVVFSVQAGTTGPGWFSNATQTVGNGNATVCATYGAPGEPGTNHLTATLYVDGQNPVSTGEDVTILSAPPPPG